MSRPSRALVGFLVILVPGEFPEGFQFDKFGMAVCKNNVHSSREKRRRIKGLRGRSRARTVPRYGNAGQAAVRKVVTREQIPGRFVGRERPGIHPD